MSNSSVMKAFDTISGALATAYITIGEKRYNLMQLISFEAKMEVELTEVSILGKTGKGTKPAGWKGTWKATAHYNQSVLREMLFEYKKNGSLPIMDIQVCNEDPACSVGRQTIILKNCLTKGGVLTKFDSNTQTLTEDISGTFDDWEMPEKFSLISGME